MMNRHVLFGNMLLVVSIITVESGNAFKENLLLGNSSKECFLFISVLKTMSPPLWKI